MLASLNPVALETSETCTAEATYYIFVSIPSLTFYFVKAALTSLVFCRAPLTLMRIVYRSLAWRTDFSTTLSHQHLTQIKTKKMISARRSPTSCTLPKVHVDQCLFDRQMKLDTKMDGSDLAHELLCLTLQTAQIMEHIQRTNPPAGGGEYNPGQEENSETSGGEEDKPQSLPKCNAPPLTAASPWPF